MSAYTTYASITGRIPPPMLINALDDGTMGGMLNTPLLNQIISDVSAELDAYLASIYPVPWNPASIPPAVSDACLHMVCAVIMARRLSPPQLNVWTDDAEKWRATIKAYGEGVGNLGPGYPKIVPPVIGEYGWLAMDMTTA
jgi:phage gp36-like protein